MEFSVKKSDLLGELNLTQGVVERKTTIPILSHLLCEAKGSRLTITATDLELSVRASCEAKVKKEGAGTIPAKKLLELMCACCPEGEIRFKLLDNHWMQITLGPAQLHRWSGMAKDNFPAVAGFKHPLVKIPAKMLSSLIQKTIFAISMEESRYTLNGSLLLLKPDSMSMVATDGHRLAVAEVEHHAFSKDFVGRIAHPGAEEGHERDPAAGRRSRRGRANRVRARRESAFLPGGLERLPDLLRGC